MIKSITKEKFAEIMQGFAVNTNSPVKIAVAVSGGGDSIALALLMNEWVKDNGGEMLALTVNHNLRPEAEAEAIGVSEKFSKLGINHKILTWEGDKPCSHIQEVARTARYNLLINECKEQGFEFLAVAHNLEDQAETFWMRLAHGSGLDGLASMASIRDTDGIKIIRPVMSCSRESLRITCKERGVEWVEDPSNRNKKYLRVKLREFEELLAEEGMTPDRIVRSIQKLEDAKQALQEITNNFIKDNVKLYETGYASLNLLEWIKQPVDIQRRVISEVLNKVYPQNYGLGFDKLENTRLELLDEEFKGKTVHGCEIIPSSTEEVLFLREESKVTPAELINGTVWDNRFKISNVSDESLSLNILGENGLSQLKEDGFENEEFFSMQFKVKRLFPAIWKDDKLLAIPHIGYYNVSCDNAVKDIKLEFVNL